MLASIIIPVYKTERYLRECVDSVLQQTYSNIEVILVDDGSPDNCPRICDEYASKDARVRVIHQDNRGLSSARNAGLGIMRGEYLFFVDSDDRVEPELVESTISLMEKKKLDAVYFEVHLIDEKSCTIGSRFHVFDELKVVPAEEALNMILSEHIESQVWKCAYRSKYWTSIRFPVGRIYEDIYTTYKAFAMMQAPVAFCQDKLYCYRLNRCGITKSAEYDHIRYGDIANGFLEKYNFAAQNCSEKVQEICMAYAATYGVLAVWSPQEIREQREVICFLRENIVKILVSEKCRFKDKIKAVMIWLSPKAAKCIAGILIKLKYRMKVLN